MWGSIKVLTAIVAFGHFAHAGNILTTNGFKNCNTTSSTVNVKNIDITFDKETNKITFNVAGSSESVQNVIAALVVTAYGVQIWQKDFNPCDSDTHVAQLCPVPAGNFSAVGEQTIPSEYASKIPSIAYNLPDIDIDAELTLKGADGTQVACIQSSVSNGKSLELPAISYAAAAVAGGALVASLVSAGMSGSHPGSSSPSPGFFEVMWWFQGLAINGMHSVDYPRVYRSFTKNFAFSTGLIPWSSMQHSIDNLRKATGGNLTVNSFDNLKDATLQYRDGSTVNTSTSIVRRSFFMIRDTLQTSTESTGGSSNSTASNNKLVDGIQGYVEQLTIPETNTFMTVLLILAIVIAAIIVGILLFKAILEGWAIWGKFPKSLTTFRKEYWRVIGQTIVSLVLLLYGMWTLYCIFQFTHGDSWAAQLLAGLTLGAFTAVLGFYTWKIWKVARALKERQGDSSGLFEDKPTWKKYRIFYENYQKQYWWLFVPFIVYMFAKGCILAAADGHGLAQTIGQLAVEAVMLVLLLWYRPYNRRSGNWINIVIQVVRVLSVACILIFVQELGISKTASTVTGLVLVVVQSTLTAILAILIAVNAIITCCKENPHRKKRKAERKAQEDFENNAFLLQPSQKQHAKHLSNGSSGDEYEELRTEALLRSKASRKNDSHDTLVHNAADMGNSGYSPLGHDRDNFYTIPPVQRQPTLPNIGYENYRHM